MRTKIKSALLLIFFMSKNLIADDYEVTICQLQAGNQDRVFLAPCEAWGTKNSCPGINWLTWELNSNGAKAMYSTALAALTSGTKIKVRVSEEAGDCAHYDTTLMIRIIK